MASSDTGYAETVMTKDQFMAQIAAVRDASSSLSACRDDEVAWEAILLRDQLNRLFSATLARKSQQLQAIRRSTSERAHEVLRRRCAQ